jgi:hypothetical protein
VDQTDSNETLHAYSPVLTSENCTILGYLSMCHEKGPGPHQGGIRVWRVIVFLCCCLAVSAGSVIFAKQIPPFLSALVCGFILGALFVLTRRQMTFQRNWRLLDSIIDWKLVERLRKESDA